jgi:hypothetical protein
MIRLSEMACIDTYSSEDLVFPTRDEIEKWAGVLHFLTGFKNDKKDGS